MNYELKPCPCGAKPFEVDWSGSTEYGGRCYQTCSIVCTECDTDVSITVNTDLENNTSLYEAMVSEVWNKLTRE